MSDSHDIEYQNHLDTWNGFTRFTTWGIVVVAAILIAMALTLV